jgi:outer membrane protein
MHKRVIVLRLALTATAAALVARGANAQLSLADALRATDRSAYANRIAAGRSASATAQTLAPLKGILPTVRVEAGYVRTTDPIGVFGSTLRQRSIAPANFDPDRLNHPDAVGNFQSGIVVEQPLFNADAWAGRRAAMHTADATGASADWTRLATRVDVIRAYYGAVLAVERASTLEVAASAAHAHVSQAEAMVRQGVVTKSDALLASVRAGDVDAQLAEAQGGAISARRLLATLLGAGGGAGALLVLPLSLPAAARVRAVVAPDTEAAVPAPRSDVLAASSAANAAHVDAARAALAYVPRINGFARYDWNSAARLYAGDHNWTVGVMASWNVFAGAGELSDIRATAGRADAAEAEAAAAAANARLQAEQTRTALVVALARLAIAERAVSQSAEAHRIVGRKYEGGLATIAELLDAQAVETQSALGLSQARWGAIAAAAERLLAIGRDPAVLTVLDSARALAASPNEPQ